MVGVLVWVAIGLGVLAVLGLAGAGWFYYRFQQDLDARLEERFADSDMVEFQPPRMSLSPLDYFKAMRHLQVQRKAAEKGYVKWFVIGSRMKRPKWVKPKQDGEGVPEYKVDGQPYYFPESAMSMDAETGAWVAMHVEGECDPIKLGDPAYPGIEVDLMERIINLAAESKPPGFLDGLAMDNKTLMWLGIGGLFVVFAAYRYMG